MFFVLFNSTGIFIANIYNQQKMVVESTLLIFLGFHFKIRFVVYLIRQRKKNATQSKRLKRKQKHLWFYIFHSIFIRDVKRKRYKQKRAICTVCTALCLCLSVCLVVFICLIQAYTVFVHVRSASDDTFTSNSCFCTGLCRVFVLNHMLYDFLNSQSMKHQFYNYMKGNYNKSSQKFSVFVH